MPFTFSHPAIILPLTYLPKRWVSVSALVIGSLTPDFEYFIRMRINSQFSHYNVGLFWFDVPLGLLLTFIFHQLVRNPLIDNLPLFLKSRVIHYQSFDWLQHFRQYWLTILISLVIGAVSHIFWDRFTHHHGYFVDLIPALNKHYYLFYHSIVGYRIVQHASTLLGALCIAIVVLQLPKNPGVSSIFNLKFWGICSTVALFVLIMRVLFSNTSFQVGHMVASMITAGMIGLVISSVVWKYS